MLTTPNTTHEVLNQAPPLEGRNLFEDHAALLLEEVAERGCRRREGQLVPRDLVGREGPDLGRLRRRSRRPLQRRLEDDHHHALVGRVQGAALALDVADRDQPLAGAQAAPRITASVISSQNHCD